MNLDGFSFAILNIHEQKYIALEHYDIQNCDTYSDLAEHIDRIIAQQELLQQNFGSASAGIADSLNTLTPKALYDNDNGKEILRFNQALLQNEEESNDWPGRPTGQPQRRRLRSPGRPGWRPFAMQCRGRRGRRRWR